LSVNIDNGIAAMAMAQLVGVTDEELREAMATFRGVERRFDFKLKSDTKVYLSDYAHHPAEIRQSARSIRELYEGRKVTAIFQPHLYSRTQDFYREFAESLSLFDEVILTDIYPAREEPIPGVTSALIYDHLAPQVKKQLIAKSEVPAFVEARKDELEVLVTLGAGDIENFAAEITTILKG
jgi:UDP-N-acetylmuramate--alanine ligase